MKSLTEQLNEGLGLALTLGGLYLAGSVAGYKIFGDDDPNKSGIPEKDAITWLAREYKKDWDKYKADIEALKEDPEFQKAVAGSKADVEAALQAAKNKLSQGAQAFLNNVASKFKK